MASASGLALHVGWPSKPTSMSCSPTRDAMATLFHWLSPDVSDLVAQCRERHRRELVVGALGLLHRQHVHVGALEPVDDPVHPRANRVDVPGGQAHESDGRGSSCPASTYRWVWCSRKPVEVYRPRRPGCPTAPARRPLRAVPGAPGPQRRADAAAVPCRRNWGATRTTARPTTACRPGRWSPRRARRRDPGQRREDDIAVDDRAEHVERHVAVVDRPPVRVRNPRQRDGACRHRRGRRGPVTSTGSV